MALTDRLRVRATVLDYDFWLDVAGAPRQTRAALRSELHANLTDATARVGFAEARRRLGSLRELARAAAGDGRGPSWVVGGYAAVAVFVLLGGALLIIATAWVDGALASGVVGRVEGSPTLFPWIDGIVDTTSTPRAIMIRLNPLVVAVPVLLAYLVGSRAWRAVRGPQR